MEGLAIILDGRPLRMYPLGQAGFHGGTESYVHQLGHRLAQRGHTIHVITNDLMHEEQRGPTEWWWGPANHPTIADMVFAVHSLETVGDLSAPVMVLLPNGVDPPCFERERFVDAVACFSQTHVDLLTQVRPGLPRDRCHVTGLGVDMEDYPDEGPWVRMFGRMFWANDPSRGLWHVLDIFDQVRTQIPEASLHVAYDFDRQFAGYEWQANALAERMWECKTRIEETTGIVNVGALTHPQLLMEQHECHVHAMPSDPPNLGSQIHGMTQMELAAAGVPLVLSDLEAFPEVFGGIAEILPVIGCLRKEVGDGEYARVDAQDWAEVVVELMRDQQKWQAASDAGRALAGLHTWDKVIDRFEIMLESLVRGRASG